MEEAVEDPGQAESLSLEFGVNDGEWLCGFTFESIVGVVGGLGVAIMVLVVVVVVVVVVSVLVQLSCMESCINMFAIRFHLICA